MGLAIPQILKRLYPEWMIEVCSITEIMTQESLDQILAAYDLIVLGGGGLYSKWFVAEQVQLLRSLSVPLVLYGIGYNRNHGDPELTAEQQTAIGELNRLAALSSVRDRLSQDFLSTLGVQSTVIGDPGLFYDPGQAIAQRSKQNGLQVGINLPCHGFANQESVLARVIPVLRQAALKLLEEGAQLTYLLHHPSEEMIIRSLEDLPLQVCDGSVPQLVGRYFALDLMIGGMLHSHVFACNAGVPFISLAYDCKQQAFLQLIGQEDCHLPLMDLDYEALMAKVALVRHHSDHRRQVLADAKARLWQEQQRFVRQIHGLLP